MPPLRLTPLLGLAPDFFSSHPPLVKSRESHELATIHEAESRLPGVMVSIAATTQGLGAEDGDCDSSGEEDWRAHQRLPAPDVTEVVTLVSLTTSSHVVQLLGTAASRKRKRPE